MKQSDKVRASLEKLGSDVQSKIRTEDSNIVEEDARIGINEYGISLSNMTNLQDPNSPEAIHR